MLDDHTSSTPDCATSTVKPVGKASVLMMISVLAKSAHSRMVVTILDMMKMMINPR